MSKILKIVTVLAVAVAAALPGAAFARGRVFFGVGIGGPGYYAPYPAYYYPPPAYYAPPPVVYYPPPQTYAPAPQAYAPPPAPAAPAGNCRQYNGDASIDASGQPFYGTACLGPDGRWHITQ